MTRDQVSKYRTCINYYNILPFRHSSHTHSRVLHTRTSTHPHPPPRPVVWTPRTQLLVSAQNTISCVHVISPSVWKRFGLKWRDCDLSVQELFLVCRTPARETGGGVAYRYASRTSPCVKLHLSPTVGTYWAACG